ncbi:MAG: hypothetical protein RSC11_05755, partial [Mucinivorans sp.]
MSNKNHRVGAPTAGLGRSRGDTEIAVNNNITKSSTVSKMRISVVELPEINCSRRLSFEFERLDHPHLQH